MSDELPTGSGTASLTGTGTSSATATRSTTWWIVWANTGVGALRRSLAAQHERRSSGHWYPSLRYEVEDGLVAVTSAVFAIEAITRQLTDVDAIVDPATRQEWRTKNKSATWRTREVLKRSILKGEGQTLGDCWRPLIERRNAVVHFTAEQRPSVPYDGVHIAVEEAGFTADQAADAFNLLFKTLDALGTRPRPGARSHAEGFSGQLDLLHARRRDGGVPAF